MPPVGFEPTISAGERPQTYALDRAATETGGGTKCIVDKLCLMRFEDTNEFLCQFVILLPGQQLNSCARSGRFGKLVTSILSQATEECLQYPSNHIP